MLRAIAREHRANAAGHAILYFVSFMGLGWWFTYGNVYLRSRGVSPAEIGIIMSVYFATGFVSQPLFGYIYDRVSSKHLVIVGCAVGASIAAVIVPQVQDSLIRILLIVVFAFFGASIMPLLDASALSWCEQSGVSFQVLRTSGSMGFLSATLVGGLVLERLGLMWAYYGYAACLSSAALIALALNAAGFVLGSTDKGVLGQPVSAAETKSALLATPFLVLLGLSLIHRLALTGPMTFIPVYMDHLNLGTQHIGTAYALAGLSEVLILFFGQRLIVRLPRAAVMLIAMLTIFVRWMITAYVHHTGVLVAIQFMHGLNFILFYLVAVQQVNDHFGPKMRGAGQTVFGSVFYGLGPVLGMSSGGALVASIGYERYFQFCALISLVSVVPLLYLWKNTSARKPAKQVVPGV